jgi:hypothetical protein
MVFERIIQTSSANFQGNHQQCSQSYSLNQELSFIPLFHVNIEEVI